MNAVTKGEPKLQEMFEKNIAQTKSVGESLDKSLAAILSKVIYELLPSIVMMLDMGTTLVRGIMNTVSDAADFLKDLFGDDEEFMNKREKEQKAYAEQMYQTDRDFDFANAIGEQMALSPELVDMIIDPVAPPIDLRDPGVDAMIDIKKSMLLEHGTSDFAKIGAIHAEAEKKENVRQASKGTQALSTLPTNDTPMAMSASTLRITPNAVSAVPTVREKFQTSNQNDVLLSRLALLKDKLHQYRQKPTKVNLSVGLNNIAEAGL